MTTEKANILLVDDQPSRLLTYEAILEPLNQTLIKARSGAGALQRLMETEFAAILLDVSMPGMDGFETAQLIHQHPRFEKIPIIFVTAVHVTDMDRLKGYQMGAVDYVYVPVIPEILRGKVQVLVQLYLQRRELQRLNRDLAIANSELAQSHSDMQAESTRELQRLNETLEKANADLAETNAALTIEIAERERFEQALQAAAKRKDEFLAVLAHELRNPLSAIHNGVQMMQLAELAEPQMVWTRDLLSRQVKHLTRLIDDLLDVSRITSGRIKLQREPTDLSVIVERAVETARPLIESRQHKLTVRLSRDRLYVDGDTVRLTQVLDNLLANAAKYTEEGGAISLTVDKEEAQDHGLGYVVIRVRDSGSGIPSHMLDRVFELFAQADSGPNRPREGQGIGLALVRGLVELHGGSVKATSPGLGLGSEFVVRLPCCAAPALASANSEATAGTTTSKLKLLLIDDNTDSAMSLAFWLQSGGHDVRLAHAGNTGVAMGLEYLPDAVLLDIGLPGMNGLEVARRLREHEHFATVPLIAMTGFGGDNDRQEALDAGFDHYLVKPIDYDVLTALLAEVPTRLVSNKQDAISA